MLDSITSQKTILVVDDNKVVREGIAAVLRNGGYSAEAVGDGQLAMSLLRGGFRPSLILLDMLMEHMDGWEFLAVRRTDPEVAAIPVVVVTSVGNASEPWALSLGATGLIRKPIDCDALLSAVAKRC